MAKEINWQELGLKIEEYLEDIRDDAIAGFTESKEDMLKRVLRRCWAFGVNLPEDSVKRVMTILEEVEWNTISFTNYLDLFDPGFTTVDIISIIKNGR